jgi:urease accessory protein
MSHVLRVVSVVPRGEGARQPDGIRLEAQERHLRRKVLRTEAGLQVFVDFEKPVVLAHGDELLLEDGRRVSVIAEEEPLMEVTGRDPHHLAQLAWHIGNRHLEAQIEPQRILLRRDHVIAHMLEHQGAKVREVTERFSPEHGAYHGHGHAHGH